MSGLLNFLQGASNAAASNVSAPVDGLAWLLKKAGVNVGTPVGGSDWMRQQGLTAEAPGLGGLLGESVGGVLPMVAAAKAPQIAAGLLKVGENAAARPMLNPQTGAIVWHGSPHKFDKFDSSKIGTGEGAQAYGHGLYLAENPAVAKDYAGALSAAKANRPVGNVDLTQAYQNLPNDVPETLLAARRDFRALNDAGELSAADRRDFLTAVKNNFTASQNGSLYKVDLPDEKIARMLDWDKPLSQQAPEVRKALKSMTDDVLGGGFDLSRAPRNPSLAFNTPSTEGAISDMMKKYGITKKDGAYFDKGGRPVSADSVETYIRKHTGKGYERAGDLYSDLAHITGNQAQISSTLRNNGIPGIRYLDGGSRGAEAGSSNFVVFPGEESALKILERNGGLLK